MIFKLLYTAIYYVRIIASQYAKLARMKTKANRMLPSKVPNSPKMCRTIVHNIRPTPKITPARFGINRQNIATKANHTKRSFKLTYLFY
jgi:hypothetical protein